ncbi:MAG: phenylalanine--tRNA ligase subunit beta, partial [Fidelibacterota bacterium]
MIASIEWLKDYVDITLSPEDLADLLTNAGLESVAEAGGKSLHIEIMPNRPDCMSHVGVAREIALLTGGDLRPPQVHLKETDERADQAITVEIVNPDECPRYACRVVKNVTVGPSPEWMAERLEATGLRSINNVVDISNYVLMELGHPLHIFDLSKVEGGKIVVRTVGEGESLKTLDGELRRLNARHLLICDARKAVALAGIMGGENSEVSERTTDVLVESAYFDPVTIRKGAKALGLSTEASRRFERGTDYEGLITALDRIAALLTELAGGDVLKGIVDQYPRKMVPQNIRFRPDAASAVAGVTFQEDFIEKTFKGLQISFSKEGKDYD